MAMTRSAPQLTGRQHAQQPDCAVSHHRDRLAGAGLGGDGAEPAGTEHVGEREEAGDEVVVGHVRGGHQGAVGQRDAHQLGLSTL
jgi:hypothetical protein